MRCFEHRERPAVASCGHCGRGACSECVVIARSGRVMCSPQCAGKRRRPMGVARARYLFSLTGVLLVAGVFYVPEGLWGLTVLLILAATACFFGARRAGRAEEGALGLVSLYYRAGDALEKVHTFHRLLSELVDLHAQFAAKPYTQADLHHADQAGKATILEAVCAEARARVGEEPGPGGPADGPLSHAASLQFCHLLADEYFELRADSLKSGAGRQRLESELFSGHMRLRSHLAALRSLRHRLATVLESEGRP